MSNLGAVGEGGKEGREKVKGKGNRQVAKGAAPQGYLFVNQVHSQQDTEEKKGGIFGGVPDGG